MKRLQSKWVGLGVLLLVLATGLYWLFRTPAFPVDPDLVRTVRAEVSYPVGGNLINRVFRKFAGLATKVRPDPLKWRFPATQPRSCGIHGLLDQCMTVSGIEYLIEKKVAPGTIVFGHTNVLDGQQWIQAFQDALQTGSPQWWDSESKEFRSENLILLRYNKKTVLVLSPATAQKYREKYPKLVPLRR